VDHGDGALEEDDQTVGEDKHKMLQGNVQTLWDLTKGHQKEHRFELVCANVMAL
jgi:hypothetical protein